MERSSDQLTTVSGINVLAGVWLVLAPFILGYSDVRTAATNDIILGVVIGGLALARAITKKNVWLSYINLALGIWLIAAPFVLGYTDQAAVWNDVILGAIVAIFSGWSSAITPASRIRPI